MGASDIAVQPCVASLFENARRRFNASADFGWGAEASPQVDGVDAVYMVHYTGERAPAAKRAASMASAGARRDAMRRVMANHSLRLDHWVTSLDREELDAGAVACLAAPAARRELRTTQVSVVAKHHLAMYDVVRSGHRAALIVEDDVLLHACFKDHLARLLADVRNATRAAKGPRTCASDAAGSPEQLGYDVLMVGGCLRMHGYRRKRKFASPALTPHAYVKAEARCGHAYLVSNRGAAAFLAAMPFTNAIDFQLTKAMKDRALTSLWAEPWLAIQGDFGGCVTNELGATCITKERYVREFDEAFARREDQCRLWDRVPAAGSVP